MNTTYTCKNCAAEFDVHVEPIIPARTYGDPADCYPESGGEIDPDVCSRCGEKVNADEVYEAAQEQYNDDKDYAADELYAERRECYGDDLP